MELPEARIAVVDENGQRLTVEKFFVAHRITGSRQTRQVEMYRLSTGEHVNFVGPEFIVASTGMRLSIRSRREESGTNSLD